MKWIVMAAEIKRDLLVKVTNWKEWSKSPLVSIGSAGYTVWTSI